MVHFGLNLYKNYPNLNFNLWRVKKFNSAWYLFPNIHAGVREYKRKSKNRSARKPTREKEF